LRDSSYITATFLTRIGILAILIFLVQILISLYKYNTRIVAFYVSRLDALRICKGEPDKLTTLIDLLTPINVDFGRDPRHPIETLVDAWRQRGKKETDKSQSSTDSATVRKAKVPSKARSRTVETMSGAPSEAPLAALAERRIAP
jgi:hypothetical protein